MLLYRLQSAHHFFSNTSRNFEHFWRYGRWIVHLGNDAFGYHRWAKSPSWPAKMHVRPMIACDFRSRFKEFPSEYWIHLCPKVCLVHCHGCAPINYTGTSLWPKLYLVVSTHLKNMSQNGKSSPIFGVKIQKYLSCHHLGTYKLILV